MIFFISSFARGKDDYKSQKKKCFSKLRDNIGRRLPYLRVTFENPKSNKNRALLYSKVLFLFQVYNRNLQ